MQIPKLQIGSITSDIPIVQGAMGVRVSLPSKSPIGLLGRVIRNKFLIDLENNGHHKIKCPYRCLSSCKLDKAKYCIAKALLNAYFGDIDNDLVFSGEKA